LPCSIELECDIASSSIHFCLGDEIFQQPQQKPQRNNNRTHTHNSCLLEAIKSKTTRIVLINFFHLVLNVQNSRSRFPRTASHDAFDPPHLADRGSLRSRSTIEDLQNPRAQKHWEKLTRQCTKTLGKSTNNSLTYQVKEPEKKDCAFLSIGTAMSQAGKQATKPPACATAATCMACMERHRT
jgi:hypothetical protein